MCAASKRRAKGSANNMQKSCVMNSFSIDKELPTLGKIRGLCKEYHIMVLVLSSVPWAGDPSDFNERDRKRAQKVGIMRNCYSTPLSSLY